MKHMLIAYLALASLPCAGMQKSNFMPVTIADGHSVCKTFVPQNKTTTFHDLAKNLYQNPVHVTCMRNNQPAALSDLVNYDGTTTIVLFKKRPKHTRPHSDCAIV